MSSERGAHGATLTIDLGALVANWRRLQREVGGAECTAVVKADAYGLGVRNVVPALAGAGCRTFFVAHVDEGIALRPFAPGAIIYILNGLPPRTADLYVAHGLRPVLGSLAEIDEWAATVAATGISGEAALHIETGINRLGLAGEELVEAGRRFRHGGLGFPVSLVMSHFIAADEPESPLNARQIDSFVTLSGCFPGTSRSLSNSSGIFLGQKPHFCAVRPGYALYGGHPTTGCNPMQAVVTLESEILQLRELRDGETVGYGALWTARGPRKVAVISVGYADGFLRAASRGEASGPGGEALVGGVVCPFAGRVSMDLIVIDVTHAPADALGRGKPVTLIGGALTVDRVGRNAGTIGYEVLTSLGKRYRARIIDP
jgi:alanine racemase